MTTHEIYAACPACHREACVEIPQVVVGLGDLHLTRLQEFVNDFTDEDLEAFVLLVEDETFNCEEHGAFTVKLIHNSEEIE